MGVPRALKKKAVEDGGDALYMVWPENIEVRSQYCEPWYHDAGCFYWMKCDFFFEKCPKWLIGKRTVPFELSSTEVQDIDTLEDWKMAELKFSFREAANRG